MGTGGGDVAPSLRPQCSEPQGLGADGDVAERRHAHPALQVRVHRLTSGTGKTGQPGEM